MTNTKLAIEFLNFHQYFMLNWNCVNKRNWGEYNETQFFVEASFIKLQLQIQSNLRHFNSNEFEWIHDALNAQYELLNPNYFISDKIAYLNHLQNCYYLEKDGLVYLE